MSTYVIIKCANRCGSSRRGFKDTRGPYWRRGVTKGGRGTAQVDACIDRPGYASKYRWRVLATHLLAMLSDEIILWVSNTTPYNSMPTTTESSLRSVHCFSTRSAIGRSHCHVHLITSVANLRNCRSQYTPQGQPSKSIYVTIFILTFSIYR